MSFNFLNCIESTTTIAIFYMFYALALKRETFFKLNRVYLVGSLLFSISIPFIDLNLGSFSTFFTPELSMLSGFSALRQSYYELNAVIIYGNPDKLTWAVAWDYISIVYILGVIVSSIFFMVGLGKVIYLIIISNSSKYGTYRIIETSKINVPFSLFKWIIINPEEYSSDDVQQIIVHEKVHALQLHSFDLIFVEVLVILFWFNPFIYWYRTSIREVHEYLADRAVVENGYDRKDYQKLLFYQVSGNRLIGLTSRFSYSLSKNRLKMLTMMKSNKISKIKMALAIPFIAAFVFFFTQCESENSNAETYQTDSPSIDPEENKGVIVIEDMDQVEEKVYYSAEEMAKFQGKDPDEFRSFIQKNMTYPKDAKAKKIEGRVFVQFDVSSKGEVKNVTVVRGVHALLDQEAVRVVESSPKWESAKNDGKPVRVRYTFPIVFALD